MSQDAWPDPGTLATIAGLITAFAVPMLFFRIERELRMEEEDEPNWIPWADWLLMAAAWVSMLLVVLPLLAFPPKSVVYRVLPPAACGAAALFVVGYTLAILAHYRLIFARPEPAKLVYRLIRRRRLTEKRPNPEPGELVVVIATVVAAIVVFLWVAYTHGL